MMMTDTQEVIIDGTGTVDGCLPIAIHGYTDKDLHPDCDSVMLRDRPDLAMGRDIIAHKRMVLARERGRSSPEGLTYRERVRQIEQMERAWDAGERTSTGRRERSRLVSIPAEAWDRIFGRRSVA